ncbi:6-phospho-beta-glucosidase [soil metagenome]
MSRKIKIAVVGGGSTYTPELIDGFARFQDRLPVDELVLFDTSPERLESVGGVAGRILVKQGWRGELRTSTDLVDAVTGANFVLIQLRVGGQAARLIDETLPLAHGFIGQETTGPGGFAKALRTVPVVLAIADVVRKHAADGAWIVDFTNPVGIVTQALLDAGHRAIGLCNSAIHFQRTFAELLEVDPDRIALEHVGLNHLTWERSVLLDGKDVLPELLGTHLEAISAHVQLPPDILTTIDAVPSKYLRFYYRTSEILREQRAGAIRAKDVLQIENDLLELYRDPTLDVKPEVLSKRGGAFYSEAAVQLIASLHDDRGDIQVVNVVNNGAMPGLADDAVIEVPARVDASGAHPLPARALPDEFLGLVQSAKAYERLAVSAAQSGDMRTALLSLVANPLVREFGPAEAVLAETIEAHWQHLPAFHTSFERANLR